MKVALSRALFATYISQKGQILRGRCPREGTFCEGVTSRGADFPQRLPQGGHFFGQGLLTSGENSIVVGWSGTQ